jgi:DNA replication protein DnaC
LFAYQPRIPRLAGYRQGRPHRWDFTIFPNDDKAHSFRFQLISARYERASVIVTSNKPFSRWGEVFGDDTVAAAMIDRLVHHAEIIAIKGDSYRLKDRDLGRPPPATTTE